MDWRTLVDQKKDLILAAQEYIWKNPETGFREWKTHRYLAAAFEKMGYSLTLAGNIPGFYTDVDTGRPGPVVLVMGEMDSIICSSHPDCDPETGAVHACGHCNQTAALLGIAAALREKGALDGLSGKIRLMAVPAEELLEIEYRRKLREDGVIHYFGGKVEYLYRGLMDGVDMAFLVHTYGGPAHCGMIMKGSNGFLTKEVVFQGVAAHAGGNPQNGVNALYAANLALNAVNALRETFQEKDYIRFHPIITNGGDSVNAIPDRVRMESYVRGANMNAVTRENRKINRAIAGCAAAMGAGAHISDLHGYWPRNNDEGMMLIFRDAMQKILGKVEYCPEGWGTGCSDLGDLSSLMPTVHPQMSGSAGSGHGASYQVVDPYAACVESAMVQLQALEYFLENGAERATKIVAEYKPTFASKKEYFDYIGKISMECDAVSFNKDGSITLLPENK